MQKCKQMVDKKWPMAERREREPMRHLPILEVQMEDKLQTGIRLWGGWQVAVFGCMLGG